MKTKEVVIRLHRAGVRKSEIARVLKVSKQYVSHICQTSQLGGEPAKRLGKGELVTVGVACCILGVSGTTIRQWSNKGKLPTYYIDTGNRSRRFMLCDLMKFVTDIGDRDASKERYSD